MLCMLSRSVVSDSAPPWTAAHQTHLSLGILQARILGWVAYPSSKGTSRPRNRTRVSCIAGRFFTSWATREAHKRNLPQRNRGHTWKSHTNTIINMKLSWRILQVFPRSGTRQGCPFSPLLNVLTGSPSQST